ncbi:MAG: peptidase S8 and S53, subtilisin, kexin, sedolisin [Ignavibacteriae bacterium]|nr:MAG: peptidase S8 and S53, subtilisin, kexin, sedolisin [Ignavibacteriota bacterium]
MRRLPSAKIIYKFLFILLVLVNFSQSQTDTLTIATYNLLNYPGTDATIRNPYFRAVVHSMKPDVLFVQEMTSQTGVNTFLNDVMNKYQPGLYSSVPFNDGPDTDNSFFYRSDKVTFLGAYYINTALRRIAEYTFRHNLSGEIIRVYSVHLKASQGYEQDRLAEATILRNYLNNLSAGTNFIVGGDFNIYTSSEPAFQKLIGSESDNDGRCFDPINAVGDWSNNYAFRFIHTQSPRVRAFGGGSTGGMDDRFDMQLISESMLDNIIVSSYKAYGNDGNHFNDSINRLPNYAVPDSVANGLHYASDHIPVVAKYVFTSMFAFNLVSPANNSIQQPVTGQLLWNKSIGATNYDVYLSTNNPPTTIVSSNQTDTVFNYSNLIYNTKYYWKVVAKNGSTTLEATGSPFNFTTIVPAPPSSFNLLTPADNSTEQPRSGYLSWSSSSTANTYDVYLDTIANPTTIVSLNQTGLSYFYQNLLANTTYYWKVVAKNEFGSTQASNSPWKFTIANVPLAPTNLVVDIKSFNQIHLQWQDNSNNELGYRVYRYIGSGKINVSGDLPPNTTSFLDTGLIPNTQYLYEVLAYNEQGEGNFATTETFTHAQSPSIMDKYPYSTNSIYLNIEPKNNPSYTLFAIMATDDTLNEYFVQNDGNLGPAKYWQTLNSWYSNGPIKILNLPSGVLFYLKIFAKNQEDIEVSSEFDTISTQIFSVAANVNKGWNLVSVPVKRGDMRKVTIFPDGSSRTYAFENGYIAKDTLENGKGYWLKYSTAMNIELSGTQILVDTFFLSPGWNLIGSISNPVALNQLIQVPENLIVSNLYAYGDGYLFADTILPGLAYWLKANSEGYLILDANYKQKTKSTFYNLDFSNLNQITLSDNNGKKQTLYFSSNPESNTEFFELPPVPPGDAFDARFEPSSILVSFFEKNEHKILLQSTDNVLNVRWNINDGKVYKLLDKSGNIDISMIASGATQINYGNTNKLYLKVNKSAIKSSEIMQFELMQNYPNPFNPTTVISYSIPDEALVTLEIYDVLGSKVATLVNELKTAGNYNINFDASNLSGGIYFYRLTAGKYSSFKKMVLIK